MKNIIFTLILILFASTIFAQKDTVRLKRTAEENRVIVTDRPPQAVYFQLGGPAILLSANYDRRFGKRVNGAGFAAGVGFFGGGGDALFTLPVSLNYLFGRRSDFVEVAGGATFASSTSSDFFTDSKSTNSSLIYHLSAGYRHQPTTGGFFFRGGISPLFSQGDYITWFYLGCGYNF
jgi:hypothetical protein